MPGVTAVIPHWNRRELLEPLFASLHSQTHSFDEIIVVDNGSTDGSPEIGEGLGARVLRLGANLGFAVAVNRGIQAARDAQWIAILNNDVTLEPDWLAILLKNAGPQAWFVTGKILRASDHSVLDGAFDEVSQAGCACRCGAGKPDSPFWDQPRPIRSAPMTAALFRKDLFTELGPIDEDFGSYMEDVDFGVRCCLARRGGLYVPAAKAYHRGSATRGEWNSDTVKQISRNQVFLVVKHFQTKLSWRIVAGQLLWGFVALRHGRGTAFLRGKFRGWVDSRRLFKKVPKKQGLREILEASERSILEIERHTGFGWYWRIYFWLLPL